ncbi:granulocyte colony-stimulating factor receptor-like [Heptranchias perlo]|uniref:granulocyte colony-stimulating factor receptor-like n=1 Tax=Heptranchias perlo TaxID=212740 RepID=UPI00355A9E61
MFESPDYRSQHGIITILTHGGVTLGTMPITAGSNTPTFSLVFLLSFITGAVSEARGCTHISVSANTVHWGSPLFASCTVTNTSCFGDPIIHASQIIWRLDNRDLPRTQYAIVSKTVSQLNIPAFNQSAGILSCRLHRGSPLSPQHRVRIYGGYHSMAAVTAEGDSSEELEASEGAPSHLSEPSTSADTHTLSLQKNQST